MSADLAFAIDLCRKIEAVAPTFGYHVALTGGVLYKDGPRKDVDLVLYRIREVKSPDAEGLLSALVMHVGMASMADHGFVVKTSVDGVYVDLLFPDAEDGDYGPPPNTGSFEILA